jgi:DNA-binding MarR family transcriptional regulator
MTATPLAKTAKNIVEGLKYVVEHGLTGKETEFVLALAEAGPMNTELMARTMNCSSSYASAVICKLKAKRVLNLYRSSVNGVVTYAFKPTDEADKQ